MDHVVVVVSSKDTDFQQLPVQVRADHHGEVGLVWCGGCSDGGVESVPDVVVRNPVLASTRQDSTATTLVVVDRVDYLIAAFLLKKVIAEFMSSGVGEGNG